MSERPTSAHERAAESEPRAPHTRERGPGEHVTKEERPSETVSVPTAEELHGPAAEHD